MPLSLIDRIKNIFKKIPDTPCGVCDGPLDDNYGKIWARAYSPHKSPEFICMNVCSDCLDKMEMEGKSFVKAVEDWKLDDDTL